MMSTQDDEVTVSFAKPTISTKTYLSRGPSGWPETFKRDVADKALASFIQPVNIDELIDVFLRQRELSEQKVTDWHTVIGFLARTMGCSPKTVPHAVGVAFWAQAIIAGENRAVN